MAALLARRPETAAFTLEQLANRLDLRYTAICPYFDERDDLTLAGTVFELALARAC